MLENIGLQGLYSRNDFCRSVAPAVVVQDKKDFCVEILLYRIASNFSCVIAVDSILQNS